MNIQGSRDAIRMAFQRGLVEDGQVWMDMDLAFKNSSLDFNSLGRFHLALDDLNLPYNFDLIIFENIENADLKEHIVQVGQKFRAQCKNP